MSYLKQYGTSAKGNDRLLKQYGGSSGSSPMARQHYAAGGKVGGNPSLSEGLSAAGAEGAPAKPSLARPGRKMAGKGGAKKGGKTNVNVIIAQAPPKGDMAAPPKDMAGPPGPPPGPPMPPPGPPPGMPMRASGGRISNLGKYAHGGKVTTKGDEAKKIADDEESEGKYAKGGRVKRADGGWTGEGDSGKKLREQAKDVRDEPNFLKAMAGNAGQALSTMAIGRKKGPGFIGPAGLVAATGYAGKKYYDSLTQESRAKEIEDKADKAEGRKSGGRVGRKEGGPAYGLSVKTGGGGGAKGRLAKVKMYGK